MDKEKKQEFTLRITKANKSEMIVILYEMVLEYLQDALKSREADDLSSYRKNINHAKNCIDELIHSLNYDYELAGILRSLYYFYKRELSSAAILDKQDLVLPIMDMIRELKTSYSKAAEEDQSAPLMRNAQNIYAGLTYGRDKMNIDLSDQSSGRGFLV